jgi:hypothetical protein
MRLRFQGLANESFRSCHSLSTNRHHDCSLVDGLGCGCFSDDADMVMQNRQRTVFIGSELSTLMAGDRFQDTVFSDHRRLKRILVPLRRRNEKSAVNSINCLPLVDLSNPRLSC